MTPIHLLLLPLLMLEAVSPDVKVSSLDGSISSGSLVAITEQEVTVDVNGAAETFSLEGIQAIQIGDPAKAPIAEPAAWITLVDGSILLAQEYRVAGGKAAVVLVGGAKIGIPTSRLRHVRFKPQNEEQAAQWSLALKADAAGDLLVIRKGQRIDYLEGVLRTVSDDSVEFQLDSDWIPVGRPKVEGLVYSRAEAVEMVASRGTLIDRSGSRIEVATIVLDGEMLELTTPSGVEIAQPLRQVERLEFVDKNVVHLSDMEPVSIEWRPYFSAATAITNQLQNNFRPRRNRALGLSADSNVPMRLRFHRERGADEIKEYARGWAIPSRTQMEFELPDDARRFKATVGIDERVAATGHVQLVIRAGDTVLFDEPVAGGESPKMIDVLVEGAQRLQILVDYGQNFDTGDHLNLCEARIVK